MNSGQSISILCDNPIYKNIQQDMFEFEEDNNFFAEDPF